MNINSVNNNLGFILNATGSIATNANTVTEIASVTVNKAGVYMILGNASFNATNSTGSRKLTINNAATIEVQANSSGYTQLTTSHVFSCLAGTKFSISAQQNSGGDMNVSGEINAVMLKTL